MPLQTLPRPAPGRCLQPGHGASKSPPVVGRAQPACFALLQGAGACPVGQPGFASRPWLSLLACPPGSLAPYPAVQDGV